MATLNKQSFRSTPASTPPGAAPYHAILASRELDIDNLIPLIRQEILAKAVLGQVNVPILASPKSASPLRTVETTYGRSNSGDFLLQPGLKSLV